MSVSIKGCKTRLVRKKIYEDKKYRGKIAFDNVFGIILFKLFTYALKQSRCSVKKTLVRIPQKSQENTHTRVFFQVKTLLKKRPVTLIKRFILAQMISRQFCENFENFFFIEHLQWLLLYKCIYFYNSEILIWMLFGKLIYNKPFLNLQSIS